MAFSDYFNIVKQFGFYGAYHSNPVNVFIHVICVPIIYWTGQVFLCSAPVPAFFPSIDYTLAPFLAFTLNWSTAMTVAYQSYYFLLEPGAALIYLPQNTCMLLSAIAFSKHASSIEIAAAAHVVSWLAQFFGHGVHEKRAPALRENVIGALVLAPFFVHLELLFRLGYNPSLHKKLQNHIGMEVAKFRKEQGNLKRSHQND